MQRMAWSAALVTVFATASVGMAIGIGRPKKMLPCIGDEGAPAVMPCADDAISPPFQPPNNLPRQPKAEDAGGEEACDTGILRLVPSCQEDPNYPYQYPGCCYSGAAPMPRGPAMAPINV